MIHPIVPNIGTRLEAIYMYGKLGMTILLITLAGCKKTAPVAPASPEPELTLEAAPTGDIPSTLPAAVARMKEHFARVHFELDATTLDDSSKSALEANAKIMQAYPEIMVEVQGHADERGTTEYNLGLGERRAEAVRKYIATMGVSTSRIKTVSFGEERPLEGGSDEHSWSQNRRAEFRVLTTEGKVKGTVE